MEWLLSPFPDRVNGVNYVHGFLASTTITTTFLNHAIRVAPPRIALFLFP